MMFRAPYWQRLLDESDAADREYELEAQHDREIAFAPVCPPLSLGVQHAAPPACSSPATPGRLATGRPGATGGQP